MATENIQIVATAQDRASATLKKVSGQVNALGGKGGALGRMSGALGGINPLALAAGAGIGFLSVKLGEGFKSMLDEEKQLGRLDTALQNNVTNWDGNYDAINKVVSIGQDLAFTDDDIRESMIKLVPVTKDADQALDDVQLAMDIARGRGIDLEAATMIVTKAELGQVGALKKLGIEVDKNATSTEILADLQRTYNGQAEKYATTTAGQLESANIKVNEGFESLAGGITTAAAEIMKFGEQGPQAMDLIIDQIFGNGAHADALIQGKVDAYAATIQRHMDSLALAFKPAGADGARLLGESFKEQLERVTPKIASAARSLMSNDLAGAIRGSKDSVATAMDTVMWAIKHPMAQTRALANIEGALTTLQYKRGLASNTDGVNAVIDQQMDNLIAEWESISGTAWTYGANASRSWMTGYKTTAKQWNLNNPFKGTGWQFGPGGKVKKKKKRAAGGPFDAGDTVLINERGGEMVNIGARGGNVTPAHQLGRGGGDVYLDGEKVGRILDQRQGRQMALSPSSSYSR